MNSISPKQAICLGLAGLFLAVARFASGQAPTAADAEVERVKSTVYKAYTKYSMGSRSTEDVRLEKITIGYDIPGYLKQGESVWEGRVIDRKTGLGTDLLAIMWVNVKTNEVRILACDGGLANPSLPTLGKAETQPAFGGSREK